MVSSPSAYAAAFPGLDGSRTYHADCDRDGVVVSANDEEVFYAIVGSTNCCIPDCANIDGDEDMNVGLADLALLLNGYGITTGASRSQGDIEPQAHFGDGDVDVSDLALMLAEFGSNCFVRYCLEAMLGGFSSESLGIDIDPVNKQGYTGGGFAGELHHFVFDVLITLEDEDDDWTTGAVQAEAANGAVFRLAPDPNGQASPPPTPGTGEPQEYATFFSVPKSPEASGRFTNPFSVGGVAGGYQPASTEYTFESGALNAAWFDFESDSNDGPAAVMRLVIDVSGVTGADTTGGLGSVYFSDSGPADPGDILVAEFAFAATHVGGGANAVKAIGGFYVVGD